MEHQNYAPKDFLQLPQRSLPNATAVLVLGILSIIMCFIFGIIALVLSSGDRRLYESDPQLYTSSSYELLKAGRICSIIGLCIWGLFLLIYLGIFIFAFSMASFH